MTTIHEKIFGTLPNHKQVNIFTLKNKNGIHVQILDYGGIIHSIKTPDKNGEFQEITIGYDHLDQYISCNQYFGALIGRFANRIKHGKFNIDDKEYLLATNNGNHHLHGGVTGFDQKLWKSEKVTNDDEVALKLTLTSPDMEEGFPGNLEITADYCLTDDNELILSYRAITDKKTPVNLTSHTYFNLSGNQQLSILDHKLKLNANYYTPINPECIPTGQILAVEGTPLDFRQPYKIGERINDPHPQLIAGNGYDHNFVLNSSASMKTPAVEVLESISGRKMELFCTQPGLQFYTGNSIDKTQTGKNQKPLKVRHGFCLEPQHFPDSPNQSQFPIPFLEPGKIYSHKIKLKFSIIPQSDV